MAKKAKKAKKAKTTAAAASADLEPLPPLPPLDDLDDLDDLDNLPDLENTAAAAPSERLRTIARNGLRLRGGPGTDFPIIKSLPFGTLVFVLRREGDWSQVDLEGDNAADGFVLSSFLRADTAPAAAREDILDRVTPGLVKSIFDPATPRTNIERHLPFVIAGLRAKELTDKAMALMAIATIRAETAPFKPMDEGISEHNTISKPFDRYDAGTRKGAELGNTVPGDGPRFKGRGFVQLTGRSNYTNIGAQIGQPLVSNPSLANDPAIAGVILAQFLKNKETRIRNALNAGNLRVARRAVNGGSHGLTQFTDTFRRGQRAL